MTADELNNIVQYDTSATKKYIVWMCKQYLRHRDPTQFSAIDAFDKLISRGIIQNKDINSYKSIDELIGVVATGSSIITAAQQKRGVKSTSAIPKEDIAFENDKVVVVVPTTKEKSILYGRGSRWCTAAMGENNAFNSYYLEDRMTLYYVLPQIKLGKDLSKLAVVVNLRGKISEVRDNANHSMTISQMKVVLKSLGVSSTLFKPLLRGEADTKWKEEFAREEEKRLSSLPDRDNLASITMEVLSSLPQSRVKVIDENDAGVLVKLGSKEQAIELCRGMNNTIATKGAYNYFNKYFYDDNMNILLLINKLNLSRILVLVPSNGQHSSSYDETDNVIPNTHVRRAMHVLGLSMG
jgi:hypothetical protein